MTATPLPILNQQPVEKRSERNDGALDVVEVFPTIQGEGPFAGRPAVFVRLAGCDLQCPLCDTDYTTTRRLIPLDELVEQVSSVIGSARLVVITGGEPFRQRCGLFVRALLARDLAVQFETNGTLYDESMEGMYYAVTIVCSPKTSKVHPRMEGEVDAWKYVVTADEVDSTDGLPLSSLGMTGRPARPSLGAEVYVQPCDNKDVVVNAANTKAAVESCVKYGYTLCLQMHKLVGLP